MKKSNITKKNYENISKLPQNLSYVLKARRIQQQQLGEAAGGITGSFISSIINKHVKPSIINMMNISAVLGISIDDLLYKDLEREAVAEEYNFLSEPDPPPYTKEKPVSDYTLTELHGLISQLARDVEELKRKVGSSDG